MQAEVPGDRMRGRVVCVNPCDQRQIRIERGGSLLGGAREFGRGAMSSKLRADQVVQVPELRAPVDASDAKHLTGCAQPGSPIADTVSLPARAEAFDPCAGH